MSIRNVIVAAAAVAAGFAVSPASAQLSAAPIEPAVNAAQATVQSEVKTQKALSVEKTGELQADQVEFDLMRGGPGGGHQGGGHQGGFPGGHPGGHPGGGIGHEPGHNPGGHFPGGHNPGGHNPGGHFPGGHEPHPIPHPHPGPFPHPGHGDWNRWHGHPGWGHDHDRWQYRDGRWVWWGWTPWVVGRGACDAYYAGTYRACADTAWESDASCHASCAEAGGDPYCNEACTDETRNALNSCEWSYRNVWNCGIGPVWPPVGVIIRIP